MNQHILDLNERGIRLERIAQSFDLLRIFGFKIHTHAMANLLGATPEQDKLDYVRLVSEAAFQPDEIKLYPCALIEAPLREIRGRLVASLHGRRTARCPCRRRFGHTGIHAYLPHDQRLLFGGY